MIPQDHLFGSWEFPTTLRKDGEGFYIAEALGESARAVDMEQALNDLNKILNDKMERGELVPQMGG